MRGPARQLDLHQKHGVRSARMRGPPLLQLTRVQRPGRMLHSHDRKRVLLRNREPNRHLRRTSGGLSLLRLMPIPRPGRMLHSHGPRSVLLPRLNHSRERKRILQRSRERSRIRQHNRDPNRRLLRTSGGLPLLHPMLIQKHARMLRSLDRRPGLLPRLDLNRNHERKRILRSTRDPTRRQNTRSQILKTLNTDFQGTPVRM